MKFTKFFLIICIVLCLFAVTSVCASEANDTAMTAADLQDDLEINEDNQVIETDDSSGVDDSLNEPQDDNMGISAQGSIENSQNDKLGISDDNLIGADLRADVIAINVSVQDNPIFVVDCSDDFKGNVSIKIVDGETLYDGCVKTIIKTAKLPAGNYVATASFYGDDNYANRTLSDITFTVSRVTPVIDVDVDDINFPNTAYVSVHIGNNANGTVNVTVSGKKFNGSVYNGEAIVPIFGLSAGYKEVLVEFFTNDNYNYDVNASNKFIVYPNNSLVEVHGSSTFMAGDDIELTVDTKNSTGDVHVYINGEHYSQLAYTPQRSYDICITRPVGTYTFSFHLDGDENYTGYDTTKTVYVVKKDLTIDVLNLAEVSRVGTPITFAAKLNETITGNVTFTINGVNFTEYVNNDDVVTHLYTPVNNDTLTVVAIFMGNDIYNVNVSDSREFNVDRIPTAVDVDFYSPISAGDGAQIFVTLNPEITDIVKLIIGSKSYDVAVVNGNGWYSGSALSDGIYDVQAVFAGDDRYYNCSSTTKQLFVNKVITNLNITIDKTLMSYHDFAVVNIALLNAFNDTLSINAIVTLKVNGENNTVGLVNGKGSFTLHDLNKNNYTINAVFAGDDRYFDCTSNTLNLTVNGDDINSSVSISLDVDSAYVGDDVTITVNSNPTVTGVVELRIGSDSYNVVVNKGVGKLTISDLPNGVYDIQAIFEGDNIHIGNSSEVKQLELNKIPTSISVSADKSSVSVGGSVVVGIVLNQNISDVVTVNVNDKNYLVAIVEGNGYLTLSDLTYGSYAVNAVFDGDGRYIGSNSNNVNFAVNKIKTSLIGDAIVSTYNIDEYLVIALKDSNGNPIGNVNVDVNLNGARTLTTDGNGQIRISTNGLTPNTYVARITFKGDAVYEGSLKDVTVTVMKATPKITAKSKTFKLKVKAKKYTIVLKDNTGKAIKNVKVTLKIKGKTYGATTNANGKATFKIKNLKKKGSYKAVITYGGNNLYNKITGSAKIKVR